MKKNLFALAIICCTVINVSAQNTGISINTTGSAPDPSAIFDASSVSQGALFPRMTTAQRDAIASPAKGLYIYNLDCDNINFNAGSPSSPEWVILYSSNALVAGASISANPSGAICPGTVVTFTTIASNGGSSPTYQWKKNNQNLPGETNAVYTVSSLVNGDVITCEITSDEPCVTGSPAESNAISVVVDPSSLAGVSIVVSPSGAICPGTNVTFTSTVTNGGDSPSYQWKKGGADISGETGSTYSGTTLSNEDAITCVVTSNQACVTGSPATSNTILMSVNPVLTASVTISVSPSGGVCSGQSLTFTASPVNGGLAPTYQWKVNGSDAPGETGLVFVSSSLSDGDQVSCEIVSVQPCVTGSPATSNSITADIVGGSGSLTLTPCGATGRTGPTQFQCNGVYGPGVVTVSNGIQIWQVPQCVTSITIEAWGAQGGSALGTGGLGARMKGTFAVNGGDLLRIVVGQKGASAGSESGQTKAGGGGGASYVTKVVSSGGYTMSDATIITPLIIAGGGAGSPYGGGSMNNTEIQGQTTTNGANSLGVGGGTGGNGGAAGGGSDGGRAHGGGGLLTNGGCYDCGTTSGNGTGGDSFLNGSNGGYGYPSGSSAGIYGGFGGGGGGTYSGGGGGGYSGGAGGYATPYYTGGGGGSYNIGSNQTSSTGVQSGNGQVVITW